MLGLIEQVGSFNKLQKQTSEDDAVNQRTTDEQIVPSLVKFLESLDQQLHKALQITQPSTLEYLHRLRDECKFLKTCDKISAFLTAKKDKKTVSDQARVALMKLDHIYYKHDKIYEVVNTSGCKKEELYTLDKPSQQVVEELVKVVIDHGSSKLRLKAILLQSYHHALHNRFEVAVSLMMRSRISQKISKKQISLKVIYNRAVVQCGLSAFRLGHFDECN